MLNPDKRTLFKVFKSAILPTVVKVQGINFVFTSKALGARPRQQCICIADALQDTGRFQDNSIHINMQHYLYFVVIKWYKFAKLTQGLIFKLMKNY